MKLAKLILALLFLPVLAAAQTATPILSPNIGQTGNSANSVQPPVLTFGKQGTSTASMAIPISVNNCSTTDIAACTGTGSLTLGGTYAAITGTNASDFTIGAGPSSPCSNNLVITSGSFCELTITFTPTASSGTNETATLTVSDNGTTSTQTMSLTGTSATVTTIAACGALSASTNYQLAGNVTANASCFTIGGSNIDFNLNGFTVIYGNASNSTIVGGFFNSNANTNNIIVHNGIVNEGAGTNTGVNSTGDGSGVFICANRSSATAGGWQLYNVTSSIKATAAKMVMVEDDSNATHPQMHDIVFTDADPGTCGAVGCRSQDQYYCFVWSDNRSGAEVDFYNISGTGCPQGGVVSFSPSSTFNNNNIAPGGSGSTVTNGFAEQLWGSNQVAQNNIIKGAGPNGSCTSCRGIQSGSAGSNTSTSNLVQNNVLHTYNLNNNLEYGGCQIDGSYGLQINTAGSASQTASQLFQNNKVYVTSHVCPGFGFSWSGANTPANNTKNNIFSCVLVSNTDAGPCAGARFDANQYNPHVAGVIGTNDTYIGDTSAVYIWYDGTPTWTCNQCTFGSGTNPHSGWVMLDYDGGQSTGQSSDPMFLIDPTFTGLASKSSNNLATWASHNSSLSFSYTVQWTYTVTVKNASNVPINGASVTITDSTSTQECNLTTNSSGVASCVLNDTKYSAASGSYTTPSFNPMTFVISATGCTTLNYGETVIATTTETKNLAGCSGAGPLVSLSPTSLAFGSQIINTTSGAQTITLTNTGSATLNITNIALTGTNAASFGIVNNLCGSTLGAGLNCTIQVTFTPTVVGANTANLTFTTNAATSPDNVSLSGTGIYPFAAVPSCSPGTGSYATTQTVTCTDASLGAIICYTINGTIPATNGTTGCTSGTLYTTPLAIILTTTLKTIAGGAAYSDSAVVTYSYVIPTAAKAAIMAGRFSTSGGTVIIYP